VGADVADVTELIRQMTALRARLVVDESMGGKPVEGSSPG
jgi:hypothetical protein